MKLRPFKWFLGLSKKARIIFIIASVVAVGATATGITIATLHHHTYAKIQTAPTCVVQGYTTYICECGDSYIADYVAAKGHTEVIDAAVAATCTTDGKTEGKHCSVCNETLIAQNNIPASHTTGEWVIDTNATCTEDGSKHQVCAVCSTSIKTEKISATGHTDGEWITDTNATCTEDGSKHQVCAVCSTSIKTEKISATGHTDGEWVTDADATCTVDGSKHQVCFVCTATIKTEPIAATGHTDGAWITAADATCTVDGRKHQVCSVCTATIKTEPIAATGHTNGEWITDTNATCTVDGSKHQVCSVCTATIKTEAIAATGHTNGEWITDTDATCTVDGSKHQVCSVCSATIKTEAITTKGHSYASEYDSGDCKNSAKIIFNCSKCGDNYSEMVNPISAKIYKSGSSSINGYIYSATYTVIATGGYGQLQYKYEVLSSATNSTVILTGDYSTDTAFGFQSEYSLNNRVLRVTIKDIYGNETTYEILVGDDSFLVNGEIANQKSHNYVNDICTVCGEKYYSRGLKYTYLVDEDAYEVSGIGTCTDTKVYIPDIYDDKPVISIGDHAFYQSDIKEMVLGDNIERIEDWAFTTSTKMMRFTISENSKLNFIGEFAFAECISLYSFTLPASLETISYSSFFDCCKLLVIYNNSNISLNLGKIDSHYLAYYAKEIVKDGSTLTKMGIDGDYVYYTNGTTTYLIAYVGNSTVLQLPDSLNGNNYHIYKYGLSNLNISHLVLSKGVIGIGDDAFENSKANLAAISISAENTVYKSDMNCIIKISNNALVMGCNNSLIPNYVTRIEDDAFNGCNSIESVTIPHTVTYLGNYAFANCVKLKNVIFAEGINLRVIENEAFYHCEALAEINIPDSVEDINIGAFSMCIALEKVNFSEDSKLTVIGSYAFQGCQIMKIFEIPKTVTTIDMHAFNHCWALEKIFIHSGVSSVGDDAFYYCKVLTIYVEVSEKPSGWHSEWNDYDCPVVWGHTP